MEKQDRDGDYYTIKIRYLENNLPKDDLYIAKITQKWNKYKFEPITSFFGLNASGEVSNIANVPYTQFGMKADGLNYVFGKIFDKEYTPYLNGKPIPVDDEGIYVVVQKQEPPSVKVEKMAQYPEEPLNDGFPKE